MSLPDFSYEQKLWRKGYQYVGGADEVGRGAFAGPVFAACVGFSNNFAKNSLHRLDTKIIINDSKKLTQKQKERAYYWIKENAEFSAVGRASVTKINKLGIVKATNIAFRQALNSVLKLHQNMFLLLDAFYIPYVKGVAKVNQLPIKKGDASSFSIAAASIVAKVERDRFMTTLGNKAKYKKYNWQSNKGYGTTSHRLAISTHGATPHHRNLFIKSYL